MVSWLQRTKLRDELNQQIAELNTLKSLPLSVPGSYSKASGKGGPEVCLWFKYLISQSQYLALQNFHGLVQRLVQKEKQVLQLQTELDRFKAQNPSDGRDAVRILYTMPFDPLLNNQHRMSALSAIVTELNGTVSWRRLRSWKSRSVKSDSKVSLLNIYCAV